MSRPSSARPAARLALIVTAVLVALAASQFHPAAGERFKPFKMKTLEGAQRSLADLLGKATLVVFFFPTCTYCNAAFPDIQKIYDSYKDRGLSMVWINILPEENTLIEAWKGAHGYTVPILLGGKSVQNDYKLTETPTHYLLDATGNVISKHAGYRSGDEKTLEQQIQQALSQ